MKTPNIIRRLVNEISAEPINDEDDNLPIEYYELRELAKNRVLLKSSLKTHIFIYLIVNTFLIILNILGNIPPVSNFTDLWSLWSILGWGLLLVAHTMILVTNNIPNLEYRIYIITSTILLYIGLFLIYLNNYLFIAGQTSDYWWYWPDIAIILFISAYAWIVFYSENKEKFKSRVDKEIAELIEKEELKENDEKSRAANGSNVQVKDKKKNKKKGELI
ncbi:MAG: 2TM domain-containing protein [Promethearchaeota archaeon]